MNTSSLNIITERIAASLAGADTTDLGALSAIHTQFDELAKIAAELDAQHRSLVSESAGKAKDLLEKIILRESADVAESMKLLTQTVIELQSISQPTGTEQPSVAQPAPKAKAEESSLISADDASLVVEFIGEARTHIESAEAGVLKVEEHPDDLEAINAIFRAFHTIKGVAGFLNLKAIGSLSHAAENLLDRARQGEIKLVGIAVDLILESIDLMKALIARLEEALNQNTPVASDERLPELTARLEACAKGENAPKTTTLIPTSEKPSAPPRDTRDTGSSTQEGTVKVSTARLDSLIDMVGELVIAESMVHQGLDSMNIEDQRLLRNVSHLGKITRNLQDLSMSMRMVPIQGTFQKMARLVRDLAKKSGKQIELTVTGAETELDRNVVEAIADPLVHMIRNSVDHGIEPPDERARTQKSPTGQVELKAYHQSGNVIIEIIDDGRGLRKDKILNKARAAGLVKEGQELSEEEIFNLIFHAGLSTAEKLTDVSGRGVGMDVVKRNVEALRGQIIIRSVEGKGSTFTIRLPLTLAVIDGLAVRVGSERYIVPITSVEQSIRPAESQISTVQSRGEMCLVRGMLLPVIRLYRLFGIKPKTENIAHSLVVIVQDNHRRCCLLVDELLGQQQVVIKSLGAGIGKVAGISGGAILGDGNVSLILDVPGLIDSSTDHSNSEGATL